MIFALFVYFGGEGDKITLPQYFLSRGDRHLNTVVHHYQYFADKYFFIALHTCASYVRNNIKLENQRM